MFERIKSLLYYSICTYQRKHERCALTIYVNDYFPFRDANMRLKEFFIGGYEHDNPLTSIKEYIKEFNKRDYILILFAKPFDLKIRLKTEYIHDERIETEEEEEQIKAIKSIFKSDECIICLNKPPNILFCNCRHICICDKCDETNPSKICPTCKTYNSIKRII